MKHLLIGIILIIFLVSFQDNIVAQPKYWQSTAEIYGGHILTMAINAGGDIFAATRAGLFRSRNDGENWTRIHEHNDLRTIAINSVGFVYTGAGNTIFRSTDNGDSWIENQIANADIRVIAINSNDHIFVGSWGSGIFRSTEDGNTWQQINSGLSNTNVLSLAINPSGHLSAGTTEGKVFLSTNNGDSWTLRSNGLPNADIDLIGINSKGHLFALPRYWPIYRSTDNGANWTAITNWAARALAFDAQDNIYADWGGVARSTDNGTNWVQLNNQLTNNSVGCLAISPNEHIFAGMWHGGGIFRSSNKGNSWQEINNGLTNAYIYSFLIDSDETIYSATGSGIYRSNDYGQHWTRINKGLPTTDIRAITATKQGYLLAGPSTSWGYINCSMDKGNSWFQINMKMPGFGFTCLIRNSQGHIFAGTSGGVYRSTDNGITWKEVNSGMTQPYIYCLAINSQGHLFAGLRQAGIYRSTNNGDNWIKINNGLTDLDVWALLATSGNTIFAGTTGGGIFRSIDNGNNWISVNTGLIGAWVTALAMNSTGQLFAGTENDGIFRSKDNGDHWEGLDSESARRVGSLVVTSRDYIFAGTSGNGIFRSIESTSDFKNAPIIISVDDVPNDQGGFVNLKWQTSALDINVNLLSHYSIWRAIPGGKSTYGSSLELMNPLHEKVNRQMQRMTKINGKIYAWEWLADQPAHRFLHYTYTAPTLYDSMNSVDGKHYFLISAHTLDPNIFYDSDVDSGYSVDNLRPNPPLNLAGYDQNQTFVLHWRPNEEKDLKHYLLYRNTSPNIDIQSISAFEATTDTCLVDSQPLSKEASFYVVVAEDIHGNLSPPSNEIALSITNVPSSESNIPIDYALHQNHPNPFNPTTIIQYDLPAHSHVRLIVYDLLGRQIKALVDSQHSIGRFQIAWDGTDEHNQPVTTGLYFCRMEAGEFVRIIKLALVK